MTLRRPLLLSFAIVIFLTSVNLKAAEISDTAAAEIEHLLDFVGDSGCVFNRNGDRHAADEAESHLRMKFGNGKRYVSNTEQFIDRIATKSSWSGRKYTVDCPGKDTQPSGDWLNQELARYRSID